MTVNGTKLAMTRGDSESININTCTQEFFCQQGNIEVVGIRACKITSSKLGGKCLTQLLECRLILHILVSDTCQLTDRRIDWFLGVN